MMREAPQSPHQPSSLELLVLGCKYAWNQLTTRALDWLWPVRPRRFDPVINDEPGARERYVGKRVISLLILPPFVKDAVEQTLQLSFNHKEVERQFKREYSGRTPGRLIDRATDRKALQLFREELAIEIKGSMRNFTFRNFHHGEKWLADMRQMPLQDVIIEEIVKPHSTPGVPFIADKVLGPVGQRMAQAVLELLSKATVVDDAQHHLGANLPKEAFMHIVRTIDEPFALFRSKLWRNMTALAGHVKSAFPDVSRHELGSILGTFLNSSAPVQDFENYLFSLSRKVRGNRDSGQTTVTGSGSVNDGAPVDATRVMSREDVEELLQAHSRHELSGSQVGEYGRTLAALLRKSGLGDPKVLQDLLSQGYHPETISRELRLQLRPNLPPAAAKQLPLADLPELPQMPEAFIKFYQDENGRSDVTTWLQQQSTEIQELINSKFDLLVEGGRGKGLTRGRNEGTKGVCEWRVKAQNATLRIYYLPAQRDSGEITVLLIGSKANQREDLAEATRRAQSVIQRRGVEGEDADGDGASAAG